MFQWHKECNFSTCWSIGRTVTSGIFPPSNYAKNTFYKSENFFFQKMLSSANFDIFSKLQKVFDFCGKLSIQLQKKISHMKGCDLIRFLLSFLIFEKRQVFSKKIIVFFPKKANKVRYENSCYFSHIPRQICFKWVIKEVSVRNVEHRTIWIVKSGLKKRRFWVWLESIVFSRRYESWREVFSK